MNLCVIFIAMHSFGSAFYFVGREETREESTDARRNVILYQNETIIEHKIHTSE